MILNKLCWRRFDSFFTAFSFGTNFAHSSVDRLGSIGRSTMTIEICLCVIAACIFIFTIAFLIMSRNARKTMRQIDSALFEIKDNLNLLTDETLLTLSNA